MNSEKIILAFAKVKEDITFLKTEIEKTSKKKEINKKLTNDTNNSDSIKKIEKSIIKIENNYKDEIEKTHKIISKIREEFEEKLSSEITLLKAEFEEKLLDIERTNSFEGEELY